MNVVCQTLNANQALMAYVRPVPSGGGIVTHISCSCLGKSLKEYWADL